MNLSIADLTRADLQPRLRGSEVTYLCPFDECAGKRRRTLYVNLQKGVFICHRCGQTGKIEESIVPLPERSPNHPRPAREVAEGVWRCKLGQVVPLAYSNGATYLRMRGIPASFAHQSGVRYSPDFFNAPAVLFPLYDDRHKLVGAQGRRITAVAEPKALTIGKVSLGVFATLNAFDTGTLVIVEGPIDALSLACVGISAVALCGGMYKPWLAWRCKGKRVLLAFDADAPGDCAAERWSAELTRQGNDVSVTRARPTGEGCKDWNDMLLQGSIDKIREIMK